MSAITPFYTSTVWTDYETNAREFECYWFKKKPKIQDENKMWHPEGTQVEANCEPEDKGMVFIRKAETVVAGVMAEGVYMTWAVYKALFNHDDPA